MTYIEKLIAEAQPKTTTINNAVRNVVAHAKDNAVVRVAGNVGHKALVNTVGIGLAYAQPVVKKAWAKVEELASDPKVSK